MAFIIFMLIVAMDWKANQKISCLKAKPQIIKQQMPMNENVLSFQHFVWYVKPNKILLLYKITIKIEMLVTRYTKLDFWYHIDIMISFDIFFYWLVVEYGLLILITLSRLKYTILLL